MPYLKVYSWEKNAYGKFYEHTFPRSDAAKFLKKLSRHFKTPLPLISHINKWPGYGHYTPSIYGYAYIALSRETDMGTLCHEFAHHLSYVRYGKLKRWHGKKFRHELKRVYTFAKRWDKKETPLVGVS